MSNGLKADVTHTILKELYIGIQALQVDSLSSASLKDELLLKINALIASGA
jgi:hypothetical protein